jgi:hypothetical protein
VKGYAFCFTESGLTFQNEINRLLKKQIAGADYKSAPAMTKPPFY